MFGKSLRWSVPISIGAAIVLAAPVAGAVVSRPPYLQDFEFDVDADAKNAQGCEFDVTVTGTGGKITQISLKDGRIFTAGKGVLLTYTNAEDPDAEPYTVDTSGSVAKYVTNPDGNITATYTGHNGFVYFADDYPGQGIIQYTGRLVLTLTTDFEVLSVDDTAAQAVDVCELID
jgi:hypothetical protein